MDCNRPKVTSVRQDWQKTLTHRRRCFMPSKSAAIEYGI